MRSLILSAGVLGILFAACANGTGAAPVKGTTSSSSSGSSSGHTTTSSSGSGSSSGGKDAAPDGPASTGPIYHVQGNQVLDSTGKAHIFRGLVRPSTEWNSQGQNLSDFDFKNMATAWNSNVVRVTMNQDFWLSDSPAYDPGYAGVIDSEVQSAESYGMDVILDLHWSDRGSYSVTPGQQCMADQHSLTFWQEVAAKYANDGHILFELYNEPYGITAQAWLSGGSSSGCSASFTVVGMQQLYDQVRMVAPNNLVIIGGLDWAYDLSAVSGNLVQGTNILYNTHPYSYKPNWSTTTWDQKFGFMTANYPVIATEFGDQDCSAGFDQTFTQYAHTKGIHWTGWAYWSANCNEPPATEPTGTGSCCAFPSLIADLSGTPIPGSGTTVQAALVNGP
jgi:hypothetical protein